MCQTIARVVEQATVGETAVAPTAQTILPACCAEAPDRLVLADGTRVGLRQLGVADRDALARLFARLSPESRRRRFFLPKAELTAKELTYLTDIDHVNHEAIAAVDERDGLIVGVGRYARVAGRAGIAAVAFEVADELQGMGVGTVLTSCTVLCARANGFTVLTATTLWENRRARALLRRAGFRARESHAGEIDLELQLTTPSGARADLHDAPD